MRGTQRQLGLASAPPQPDRARPHGPEPPRSCATARGGGRDHRLAAAGKPSGGCPAPGAACGARPPHSPPVPPEPSAAPGPAPTARRRGSSGGTRRAMRAPGSAPPRWAGAMFRAALRHGKCSSAATRRGRHFEGQADGRAAGRAEGG